MTAFGGDVAAAKAALLRDLVAAGVLQEVGEEAFDWFGMARAGGGASATVAPVAARPVVVASKPKPTVPVLASRPLVGEVWACGEGGGLVVVCSGPLAAKGKVPLTAREQALLAKMLAAAGVGEVSGWAVAGQDDERLRPALQQPLLDAVAGLQPACTLVLGSVALGTLLGGACGVEAWQSKCEGWQNMVAAGVTYPPAMLLEKPVFKRLAWQHLLAWQARMEGAKA